MKNRLNLQDPPQHVRTVSKWKQYYWACFSSMLCGVLSVLKSTFYKFLWLESTWENLQHSLSTLLTRLRTTYISLFSSLITNYKHYRIPIPVPFVDIYIYILFKIHFSFWIIHTTASNRITGLQQWQNLFFLIVILNSTHQLNWVLLHIKWTSFNLTKNSKPSRRLIWFFFPFLVFLPYNSVFSYFPKLLLSSKTRSYFYSHTDRDQEIRSATK